MLNCICEMETKNELELEHLAKNQEKVGSMPGET